MEEREVLSILQEELNVKDDCGVIKMNEKDLLITTDMLRRATHIPDGIENKTIGWRCIAVSLSDIAAMGGKGIGAVLAIGTQKFEEIREIATGAQTACKKYKLDYSGGDIIRHQELTLSSSVIGTAKKPIFQSNAKEGDKVCVTGKLGKTALALKLLEKGEKKRPNELFKFDPRIKEGRKIAKYANSMTDISDGIAVELNKLATSSDVGFNIRSEKLPLLDGVEIDDIFIGEDYELLFTIPPSNVEKAKTETQFSIIGECTDSEVKMDGQVLEKKGYQH